MSTLLADTLRSLALVPLADESVEWHQIVRVLIPTFHERCALTMRSRDAYAEIELVAGVEDDLLIDREPIDAVDLETIRAALVRPLDETDPYARDGMRVSVEIRGNEGSRCLPVVNPGDDVVGSILRISKARLQRPESLPTTRTDRRRLWPSRLVPSVPSRCRC